MKRAIYHNRYGDNLVFEELNENEVQMSGFDHYRCGEDFIDPSGGPFIRVGMDVGRYFMDGKIRIIKEISLKDKKATITI